MKENNEKKTKNHSSFNLESKGVTKEIRERKKDEREKPLLFKRHKVVRFLISPKIMKEKIEVNKIMK